MVFPSVTNLRQSRTLWTGTCLVLAVLLLGFGFPFAIGGLRAAPFPSVYEVITRYIPGDLHTYGIVMLALGFSLLIGLKPGIDGRPDDRWSHYTLALILALGVAVAAAFAGSWALTGVQTWQAILYWLSIGAFAFLCWRYPPADDGSRRVA